MKIRLFALILVVAGLLSWLSVQNGSSNITTTTAMVTTSLPVSTTITVPPSTTSTSTSTSTTLRVEPPSGDGLSPFTPELQGFINSRNGTSIDAAILDLNTDTVYRYSHGTKAHVDASIVKVAILEALLVKNHGVLPAASQELARLMIEVSSNEATTRLWNNLGGSDALTSFDTNVGLTSTVVSKCLVCPGFPWPGWGLTTTNSLDQLTLLKLIAKPNQWLTPAARNYISSLMSRVIPSERWGVSSGVPSPSFVQLKNGWLPLHGMSDWDINSIGWIHGGGRNYLAVVLTSGNPTMGYGVESIERISRQFWRTRSAQIATTTTTTSTPAP